jgi:hypothetical protein
MLILKNNHPPMRKLTQPWKLRRSFGSQPVGNVAGPRWTEAGIATQVLPSQSLRWTFRKGQSPTGELPTCGLDSSRSSDVRTTFNSKVGKFAASFSCRPRLPFQGSAIIRTSSSVFRARPNPPEFAFSLWKQ